MKKIIAGLGIVLAVVGVAKMVPDFVRYMRIRAM